MRHDLLLVVHFKRRWDLFFFCMIIIISFSLVKAHSVAPPPPPIRARPTSMDEERSDPAISPEPPVDGDAGLPAPQPNSHSTPSTERANSCTNSQKPRESEGRKQKRSTRQETAEKNYFKMCFCVFEEEQRIIQPAVWWSVWACRHNQPAFNHKHQALLKPLCCCLCVFAHVCVHVSVLCVVVCVSKRKKSE